MQENTVIEGDALSVLGTFSDESIDLICTSPPYYGLRDYGIEGQLGLEKTPQEYISKLMEIMKECKRVLKKAGSLWVNIGDSYGGTGSKGEWKDPKYKEGRNGQVVSLTAKLSPKSLLGIPERFVIAMTDDNWIRRNTIIWHKGNCMPSSAKDRFTTDFEYFYFFTKSKNYYFETQYEPLIIPNRKEGDKIGGRKYIGMHNNGNTTYRINPLGRIKRTVWKINTTPMKEAHFAVFPEKLIETPIKACCPLEICTKCKKPRQKIMEFTGEYDNYGSKATKYAKCSMTNYGKSLDTSGILTKNVKRFKDKGLTDCGCNTGFRSGIVLDPFCGSGTTCLVAKKLGRRYIGIDINPDYIKICNKRLLGVL